MHLVRKQLFLWFWFFARVPKGGWGLRDAPNHTRCRTLPCSTASCRGDPPAFGGGALMSEWRHSIWPGASPPWDPPCCLPLLNIHIVRILLFVHSTHRVTFVLEKLWWFTSLMASNIWMSKKVLQKNSAKIVWKEVYRKGSPNVGVPLMSFVHEYEHTLGVFSDFFVLRNARLSACNAAWPQSIMKRRRAKICCKRAVLQLCAKGFFRILGGFFGVSFFDSIFARHFFHLGFGQGPVFPSHQTFFEFFFIFGFFGPTNCIILESVCSQNLSKKTSKYIWWKSFLGKQKILPNISGKKSGGHMKFVGCFGICVLLLFFALVFWIFCI